MIIRIATAADRAALTDFGRRTFDETFAPQNTPDNMRAYLDASFNEARQTAELADADRVTLVAENDGALVGYAQIHHVEAPPCVSVRESVELVRLYVDRSLQGHGVAHQLMRAVEEVAAAKARAIWLGVWEHNLRAIAFYEKCGFSAVGSHVFWLGTDPQTDQIMVKELR